MLVNYEAKLKFCAAGYIVLTVTANKLTLCAINLARRCCDAASCNLSIYIYYKTPLGRINMVVWPWLILSILLSNIGISVFLAYTAPGGKWKCSILIKTIVNQTTTFDTGQLMAKKENVTRSMIMNHVLNTKFNFFSCQQKIHYCFNQGKIIILRIRSYY